MQHSSIGTDRRIAPRLRFGHRSGLRLLELLHFGGDLSAGHGGCAGKAAAPLQDTHRLEELLVGRVQIDGFSSV